MQQDNLLSQLRDIRGIDAVSFWPLAPGWWAILGLIVLVIIGRQLYKFYQRKKAESERRHIRALFDELRKQPDNKKKVDALSELLRRLAIRKYGRDACAGLEGSEWLLWLSRNDPNSFDWKAQAAVMIEAPYAPDNLEIKTDLAPLIKAAERWV